MGSIGRCNGTPGDDRERRVSPAHRGSLDGRGDPARVADRGPRRAGAAGLRQRLSSLSIFAGADLCDRAAGPQSADRLQRPDFARSWRFLRDRRLWRGDPDHQVRLALLGGDPDRERRLLRRRLSVRLSRAAAGGLYLALATFALAVAAPQILSYKGFDAYTGGSQGLQLAKPHPPFGLPFNIDQWLYLVCLACAAALFWAAANLVRGRVGRALVAIRDHPIAAEAMGVDAALYKTTVSASARSTPGSRGASAPSRSVSSRPTVSGCTLSLAFLVGIVVGGLASIGGAIFGALFIEFVPNYADQLSVYFGESAKALPGAIYGVLLILFMALMPSGVAGASGRCGSSRAVAFLKGRRDRIGCVGARLAKSNREEIHDNASHILEIRRRRRGRTALPAHGPPARRTRRGSPIRKSRSARPCPIAGQRRLTA